MAEAARWAAEHPDQPWPDHPPYPEMIAKPAPSPKPTTPTKDVEPYSVPRVVKKVK